MSVYKDLTFVSLLAVTLFSTFVLGDITGSNRTLGQDEHRIAFLQGVNNQAQRKLQTYSLVVSAAGNYLDELAAERDAAIKKYNDLEEKLWHSADGSCAISMSARGCEWRLTHAGLWNKHLIIQFYILQVSPTGIVSYTPVGHAVFTWEDSEGILWIYSNGGSYKMGKNIQHDPLVIAKLLYGGRVISAEFE